MAKRRKPGGLVYSTDQGRLCPGCHRPVAECVCRDAARASGRASDQTGPVIVSRETKGRKGAGVTLIRGLPAADGELLRLASTLKTRCGVGGSVKDGAIELQGDQRAKIKALLEADGYRVKLAGG